MHPHRLRSRLKQLTRLLPLIILAQLATLGLLPSVEGLEAKPKAKPQKIKRLEADPPLASASIPALSEAQRSALSALRPDPEPEQLVRNSHYWISNEHNHQVWLDYIRDIGGAYVGVGTDQNFLLAGWARSELLLLMDFDGEIPKLHEIYEFFFSISASPKTFHLRWHRDYSEDSQEKLRAYFEPRAPEGSERQKTRWVKQRIKIYKLTRGIVYRRLLGTLKKYNELKIKTFITDQAQYDYIRSLWATGRVLAIRGDLTADRTMLDIGRGLREMGISLNTLYLSNAEQYFELIPSYRRNIIELPWGERSYALRTLGWKVWGYIDPEEAYHYNAQSGANFVDWMKRGRYNKAGHMLRKRTKTEPFGTSIMDAEPVVGRKAPEIAATPER